MSTTNLPVFQLKPQTIFGRLLRYHLTRWRTAWTVWTTGNATKRFWLTVLHRPARQRWMIYALCWHRTGHAVYQRKQSIERTSVRVFHQPIPPCVRRHTKNVNPRAGSAWKIPLRTRRVHTPTPTSRERLFMTYTILEPSCRWLSGAPLTLLLNDLRGRPIFVGPMMKRPACSAWLVLDIHF